MRGRLLTKVKYVKVDGDGFFVEDVVLDIGVEPEVESPYELISVPVPEGFYRPRWVEGEWVEGLTEEELERFKNTPDPIDWQQAIGNQIVSLELENYLIKQQNDYLGSQLVDLELRILQLERGDN